MIYLVVPVLEAPYNWFCHIGLTEDRYVVQTKDARGDLAEIPHIHASISVEEADELLIHPYVGSMRAFSPEELVRIKMVAAALAKKAYAEDELTKSRMDALVHILGNIQKLKE